MIRGYLYYSRLLSLMWDLLPFVTRDRHFTCFMLLLYLSTSTQAYAWKDLPLFVSRVLHLQGYDNLYLKSNSNSISAMLLYKLYILTTQVEPSHQHAWHRHQLYMISSGKKEGQYAYQESNLQIEYKSGFELLQVRLVEQMNYAHTHTIYIYNGVICSSNERH